MKVLITGVKGQLGGDVATEFAARGIAYKGVDIDDFDITNRDDVFFVVREYRPDAVIHCAAYTAVDKAEDEPELCLKINAGGTRFIAEACKEIGAKMLYISTDYVFPGCGSHFHLPDEPTRPLSVYGETKLAGENAVRATLEKFFIVRISWVFGANGNNFVKTMLRLGEERDCLNVVCDQIGSPTYTSDLAPLLADMVAGEKYGVYHATNEGVCSWAEFAAAIFEIAGLSVAVNPIPTSEYTTRASRPLNSRLDKHSIHADFQPLPHWRDALWRFLRDVYGS